VADGEFCVLLGPSGCGKSTLLRIVAGLETATSGNLLVDDVRIDGLSPRERDVAFVFQNYALYPHMTVFDNLAFSLKLQGVAKSEIQTRVRETARLLEIDSQLTKKPQQLSGGQRQRVALGRAIVRRPKIFLFDEPLSNLDATLRANMRVELARLHERLGATMLYVTHDQAEAMTLGEKIIVLNHGAVQQVGTPRQIYRQPANTFVAGFVGTPRMNLIDGALAANGSTFTSGALQLDLGESHSDVDQTLSGKTITLGIRPEHLTLTDPAKAMFRGMIELVEDLGADRFIYVNCAGVNIIARLTGGEELRKGEAVCLRVQSQDLNIFCGDERYLRAER